MTNRTEYQRNWRKNNPDKVKETIERYRNSGKAKRYLNNYRNKLRIEILNFLGGACIKCNFSDPRALQVDHVNGGGKKELRTITSYNKYFKMIKSNPEKYQLLCANCNWIKRVENKEHL